MSNLKDHLNKQQLTESKSLFDIISTFFNDFTGFMSFSIKARKATKEYQIKVKNTADSEGNMTINQVNALVNEYVKTLESLVKGSKVSKGVTDAFMADIYKEIEDSRKGWT
jgi:capsular polysaccharide biosynthesis protein